MNTAVGALIWAGEIARALWEYFRAGGGAAGWEAAREALRERFPGAAANSINSLIDKAQQVNNERQRYGPAGPAYVPPPEAIPDFRRNERDAGVPPDRVPGEVTPPRFYHEGIITIYDERYGDTPIQQFSITLPADHPYTHEEFLELLNQMGEEWLGIFGSYEGVEGRLEELYFVPEIIGIWEGY